MNNFLPWTGLDRYDWDAYQNRTSKENVQSLTPPIVDLDKNNMD